MRELLKVLVEGVAEVGSVSVAANLWEARLEISRHRPDLVLLDEILPGESSLDLLSELERDSVPVLLVTGVSDRPGRLFKPQWGQIDLDRDRFRNAILKAIRG